MATAATLHMKLLHLYKHRTPWNSCTGQPSTVERVRRAGEHRGTGAPGRRTPWNGFAGQANTVERVRRAPEHRGTAFGGLQLTNY